MTKINQIQSSILSLDPGAYQKLMDNYHKLFEIKRNIQQIVIQEFPVLNGSADPVYQRSEPRQASSHCLPGQINSSHK